VIFNYNISLINQLKNKKMNGQNKSNLRYSDKELADFKIIVTDRLKKTISQRDKTEREIYEMSTNESNRFDSINESSLSSERDYLIKVVERQEKFVRDLHNALLRIENKTYGVCIVTRELIDKKRLKAVPHTTKSMKAKLKQ
jgi:RNA polymerase-binding transcription factor DksA